MESNIVRLECLKLAVSYGSLNNISDPIELADTYVKWVNESQDKPQALERKPLSKVVK
jgi:hypothetical protein|tara:strand:+ start:1673 stop:1846 length:174 start_codon:yes stop_codon:yes gene_type:complete